jgi:hypothetical protein
MVSYRASPLSVPRRFDEDVGFCQSGWCALRSPAIRYFVLGGRRDMVWERRPNEMTVKVGNTKKHL